MDPRLQLGLAAFSGVFFTVLLAAGSFLCAWAPARRAFRGPRQTLLAAFLLQAAMVSVLFHVLLPLRLYFLPCLLSPFVAGAAWILLRDRASLTALRRAGRGTARQIRRAFPLRWAWVWGPFALLTALLAARALFLPPLAHDALSYHLPKAAMWIQGGGGLDLASPGGWSYYRLFPGGWEALLSAAMLPSRAETAAAMLDAAAWLGLGILAWEAARTLGARGAAAGAAAAFALFLPASFRAAGACYVENAQALFLLCALVFRTRYRRAGNPWAWAFAAVALGLAAAMKSFLWPVIALLGLVLVVDAVRARQRRPAWAARMAGLALAAAVFLPWLGWAGHYSGAPLSPFPVRIGGLELGRAGPMIRWYLDRPAFAPFDPELESLAFWSVFHLPGTPIPQIGLAALIGVAAAAGISLRRRPGLSAPGAGVALLTALAGLALFYSPAFAANRLNPYWSFANGRFLHFTFILLGVLAAARASRSTARARGAVPLGLAALVGGAGSAFAGWTALEWMWIPALAGGLLLAAWGLLSGRATRVLPPTGLAAAVLGIALAVSEGNRWDLWRQGLGIHVMRRGWIEPARRVWTRPGVIAVTSGPDQNGDNWMLYPLLGRGWRNRLVYVPPFADGQTREFAGPDALLPGADYTAWRTGLDRAGATRVVSFAPDSIELMWMLRDPQRFKPLVGGAGWGLFERLPELPPEYRPGG